MPGLTPDTAVAEPACSTFLRDRIDVKTRVVDITMTAEHDYLRPSDGERAPEQSDGIWSSPAPLAEDQPKESAKRTWLARLSIISLALLIACGAMFGSFAAGVFFERETGSAQESQISADDGEVNGPEVFANAWDTVLENYVDEEAIDEQAMLDASIQAMLDTLGDQGHTRYLNEEATVADAEQSSGSYVGIGVLVEPREDSYVVVTPFDGSPAQAAGVRPGDVIVAVDGERVTSETLTEVIAKIRGEEGTDVSVTFFRPDSNEELTFTMTRQEITVPVASWVMLEDNVALLRLTQFSNGAGDALANALSEAQAAGAEGVILDLRNNPGGYIREAMQVASMFVPPDSVVYVSQTRDGGRIDHKSSEQPVHLGDLPLVVLINEGSASSSEIVAGAIAGAGTGTLIGETTVGTGTVLSQFPLGDGSTMWLGVELWLTPEGDFIREQGIRPAVIVALEEDQTPFDPQSNSEAPANDELNDRQLEYAIDALLMDGDGASTPTGEKAPPRLQQ
jgi:carboxyl-terminal processing protease